MDLDEGRQHAAAHASHDFWESDIDEKQINRSYNFSKHCFHFLFSADGLGCGASSYFGLLNAERSAYSNFCCVFSSERGVCTLDYGLWPGIFSPALESRLPQVPSASQCKELCSALFSKTIIMYSTIASDHTLQYYLEFARSGSRLICFNLPGRG